MCAGNNYLGNFVAFGIFYVRFLPLGVKKILDTRSGEENRLEMSNRKKTCGGKKNLGNFFRTKIWPRFFLRPQVFFQLDFPSL